MIGAIITLGLSSNTSFLITFGYGNYGGSGGAGDADGRLFLKNVGRFMNS